MRFNLGSSLHPPGPVGVTADGGAVRLDRPHPGVLVLERDGGSAREFAGLFGPEPGLLTPEEVRAFRAMGCSRVDAVRALDRSELKRRLLRAAETLRDASEAGAAYLPHYLRARGFLDGLRAFRLDPGVMSRLAAGPDAGKVAPLGPWVGADALARYSMTGTVTGRLTVRSGPNMLVAPKGVRAALRSASGRPVLELDLTALEPTILFASQLPGFDPGGDLYSRVSERWFGGRLSRDLAKALVISLCYGASERALLAAAGGTPENREAVKRLAADLRLAELASRLRGEWSDTGRLLNAYGRPVRPKGGDPRDGALINNFVQSTAVDAAMEVFEVASSAPGIEPHVVIHDALYLSGDEAALRRLAGVEFLESGILNCRFRFTLRELHEND